MPDLISKLIVAGFTAILTFCTGLLTKLISDLKEEKKETKKFQEAQKKEMLESFNTLKKEVDTISERLQEHIDESNIRDIRNRRQAILDFANSCMNGRNHTKEEFDFMVQECSRYEQYCEDHNIENGVANHAIKFIENQYDQKMQNNSFL